MPEIACITPVGPRISPRIAIVGEAPGEEEEKIGIPFVGKSGNLLTTMLRRVGIERRDCYLTNVFLERPQFNNLEYWCGTKTEVNALWAGSGRAGRYPYGPITKSKEKKSPLYLKPDRLDVLDRLKEELGKLKPNLVLALGNVASWALLSSSGITSFRGTLAHSTLVEGVKVLPTYHPAAILRQWELFPIALADFDKAKRTCHTPILEFPRRQLWLEPSLEDLEVFYDQFIKPSSAIAIDVETKARQITCIGFAPSPSAAVVIPFWNIHGTTRPDHNPHYWQSAAEEVAALHYVKRVLDLPVRKVFQNGLYDIQYIWKTWGMPVRGTIEDTMIIHHALQPELSKGLGFLGSLYTDEPSWKHMRKRKSDTEKRDE